MEKHCSKTFRHFARYVYCNFRMRITILAAYRGSGGDPSIVLYVYNLPSLSTYKSNKVPNSLNSNDQLGGVPSFKSRHEDWANDPMFWDFSTWAAECFGKINHTSMCVLIGQCLDSGDQDEESNRKSKSNPDIKFQMDSQGFPMLLSWESIKDADLIRKKYLIGRYLSDMFCV